MYHNVPTFVSTKTTIINR